ncbi:MAG: hypothetical protein K0S07_650 [Chlamydiales bacterium]|jgi:uncharacterized membrane protein|nr:hypothetical protein [Chlamydiales bacterium]
MKKYFITGLVVLLPIALTVWIISFLVNLMTAPFSDIASQMLDGLDLNRGFLFLSREQTLHYGSQLLIILALFGSILLIGVVGRWFFFHYLLKLSEILLKKIPFISSVYQTSQEVIHTLLISSNNSFKQVVLVHYPDNETVSLGLITKEDLPQISPQDPRPYVSVFVPTTPNPTSGFLVLYPKEKVIYLDMKVEDALKHIISCGIIPLNLKQILAQKGNTP